VHGVQIGALLRLAKAVLALDLDVVKAMRELETLDLGALGYCPAIGDQRELDAERAQRVDRLMRAREDEHFFLAIGRKTVGNARSELGGQAVSVGREGSKGVAHHDAARFFQLQPPFGASSRPE